MSDIFFTQFENLANSNNLSQFIFPIYVGCIFKLYMCDSNQKFGPYADTLFEGSWRFHIELIPVNIQLLEQQIPVIQFIDCF